MGYLQFSEAGKVRKCRLCKLAYHIVTQIPEMDNMQ